MNTNIRKLLYAALFGTGIALGVNPGIIETVLSSIEVDSEDLPNSSKAIARESAKPVKNGARLRVLCNERLGASFEQEAHPLFRDDCFPSKNSVFHDAAAAL